MNFKGLYKQQPKKGLFIMPSVAIIFFRTIYPTRFSGNNGPRRLNLILFCWETIKLRPYLGDLFPSLGGIAIILAFLWHRAHVSFMLS